MLKNKNKISREGIAIGSCPFLCVVEREMVYDVAMLFP